MLSWASRPVLAPLDHQPCLLCHWHLNTRLLCHSLQFVQVSDRKCASCRDCVVADKVHFYCRIISGVIEHALIHTFIKSGSGIKCFREQLMSCQRTLGALSFLRAFVFSRCNYCRYVKISHMSSTKSLLPPLH